MSQRITSSILEKYNPQFEYAESIMTALMALYCINLWISPEIGDAEKIYQFATLIAFEFIMVHSGVFMAVMPKKISLYIFVPFYGLFALAFDYSMGNNNTIIYLYLITIFNRMRFAFFNVNESLKKLVIGKSVVSVTIYFFLMIIIMLSQSLIPKLGLSDQNLIQLGYDKVKTHGGIFLDEPHVALCFGFFYYSILALLFLSMNRKSTATPSN